MNPLCQMIDEIICLLQSVRDVDTDFERRRRIASYIVILGKISSFFYS